MSLLLRDSKSADRSQHVAKVPVRILYTLRLNNIGNVPLLPSESISGEYWDGKFARHLEQVMYES
jgi:hypothetical protein